MSTQAAARTPRPERPPVPALPEFELLDRTHAQMLQVLTEFGSLLDHLDDHGPDEQAREIARRIHQFFSEHAREHHAHEEKVVFPPLLAGQDAEMAAHVRRLQQDHGWLEEDWIELAPQIEAIAGGYNWYDLAMLRLALPVFRKLYEDHIALEESLVYPAAKQREQVLAAGQAARRSGG